MSVEKKLILFFAGVVVGLICLNPHDAQATAYGQLTVTSPTHGYTYSSSANVSTSVSWNYTSGGLYLDRRVFRTGSEITSATSDTCYFTPVSLSSSSGSRSGTLRDGSGTVSTSYSSGGCFPGGSGSHYLFVATIVYCPSGGTYTNVNDCMGNGGYIVARSTRYFTHN